MVIIPASAPPTLIKSVGFGLDPELEPIFGNWSAIDAGEIEHDKLELDPWNF
jgi:hypothetical protein